MVSNIPRKHSTRRSFIFVKKCKLKLQMNFDEQHLWSIKCTVALWNTANWLSGKNTVCYGNECCPLLTWIHLKNGFSHFYFNWRLSWNKAFRLIVWLIFEPGNYQWLYRDQIIRKHTIISDIILKKLFSSLPKDWFYYYKKKNVLGGGYRILIRREVEHVVDSVCTQNYDLFVFII